MVSIEATDGLTYATYGIQKLIQVSCIRLIMLISPLDYLPMDNLMVGSTSTSTYVPNMLVLITLINQFLSNGAWLILLYLLLRLI